MRTELSAEALAPLRLWILDVDGVLTDGSIVYTDSGEELKRFHVRDGSAIKMAQAAGHAVAILSGRTSRAVSRRAAELGVRHVWQGVEHKAAVLPAIFAATGFGPTQAVAIGDDLADLPVFRRVALGVAVADAAPELRGVAGAVTMLGGGRGAVRESIQWVLASQGVWAQFDTDAPPG